MEGIVCSTKANGGQINRSAQHNAQLRTTRWFFPARGAGGGTGRFVGSGSARLVGLPFTRAADSNFSATLAAQKRADPCNHCVCTARYGPFDVPGCEQQLHSRTKGLQLVPGASCLLSLLLLPSASTFCSISAGTTGNTHSVTTSQAFLAGFMTVSKVEAHPFLSC